MVKTKQQEFSYESTLECPDCKKVVHVGTAGHKNLEAHRASKGCRTRTSKGWQRPPKPNQVLDSFFKPKAPLNPPKVSALAPVHTVEANKQPSKQPGLNRGTTIQATICQKGQQLLQDLEAATNRIPSDVPIATPDDCLSTFAIDPSTCVAKPGEDDWPILNAMLKASFGWGEIEMVAAIPRMLKRGEYGLDGFIKFMKFFVVERGLQGVMFEMKVEALLRELESRYPSKTIAPSLAPSTASLTSSSSAVTTTHEECGGREEPSKEPDIIDVDMIDEGAHARAHADCEPVKHPCKGILVVFPNGKNEHTSYPFGLHSERPVPWNYRSIDDSFYIQAKSCQKTSSNAGSVCGNCQKLTSSTLYKGIMDRIEYGAHENVPLVYHDIRGLMTLTKRKIDQLCQLQLTKLNDSQKLIVKAGALEDHKQWILAIASGRVDRVASLVQAGLKHRAGIKTLVQQYECAADKLYQPKGYTNEDIMRSIVLLRLGGARVAEFAHRSLSLPSVTTIRRNTILQALVVSPSTPTTAEVEANIISCYAHGTSSTPDPDSLRVIHQIVMLDELAVEKRV